MGLCSTEDPVKLLENLGKTVKSDGKILMLEHGISHYAWVNDLLHRTAIDHAKEHGCWWDRDIGAIVEKSGLEVEQIKRYNFGTTWWLELRPKKSLVLEETTSQIKDISHSLVPSKGSEITTTQEAWWQFW
jgi:methyltransferase OMS1